MTGVSTASDLSDIAVFERLNEWAALPCADVLIHSP